MDMTDTLFILVCSALVFFMTPGLALFYAGFDREQNAVNLLFQNFLQLNQPILDDYHMIKMEQFS